MYHLHHCVSVQFLRVLSIFTLLFLILQAWNSTPAFIAILSRSRSVKTLSLQYFSFAMKFWQCILVTRLELLILASMKKIVKYFSQKDHNVGNNRFSLLEIFSYNWGIELGGENEIFFFSFSEKCSSEQPPGTISIVWPYLPALLITLYNICLIRLKYVLSVFNFRVNLKFILHSMFGNLCNHDDCTLLIFYRLLSQ